VATASKIPYTRNHGSQTPTCQRSAVRSTLPAGWMTPERTRLPSGPGVRGTCPHASRLPSTVAGVPPVGASRPDRGQSADLEHDLASSVPGSDPRQRLAGLVERQDCFGLRAEFAGIDKGGQLLKTRPVAVGSE
jgi:hypothetical protein